MSVAVVGAGDVGGNRSEQRQEEEENDDEEEVRCRKQGERCEWW